MALPTTPRTVLRVVTTELSRSCVAKLPPIRSKKVVAKTDDAIAIGEEDAGEDHGEADLEDEEADVLHLLQPPDQPFLDVGLEVGDIGVDVLRDGLPVVAEEASDERDALDRRRRLREPVRRHLVDPGHDPRRVGDDGAGEPEGREDQDQHQDDAGQERGEPRPPGQAFAATTHGAGPR